MHIVKTASGIVAVQVVRSSRRGSRDIEHVGPSLDDAGLDTWSLSNWLPKKANNLILEGIPEYRSPGSSLASVLQ